MSHEASSVATRSSRGAAATVFALGIASFVVMVDSTVAQVMLPNLMEDLGVGLDGVLWVANAFTLVYGVLLLPGARLGDMFGRRALLVTGLVLFLAGSVLCGSAWSLPVLVAGRVVQAIGGALLIPQTLGILATSVPEHRRGLAFGLVSASMALAAVVGPVLGGIVVSFAGWRWVFLANVPGCALAIAAVAWAPASREPKRAHELDVVGVLLVIAGLGAVVYGFIAGARQDLGSGAVPAIFGVGAALLAAFLLWERRAAEPLVPLGLFGTRGFSVALWLGVLQFVLMFGVMLVVTLKVQTALGGNAFQTGIVLLPMAVAAGVVSPFAGHATDRWRGRPVIVLGFLVMGGGLAWLALVSSAVGTASLFAPLAAVGVGVGLLMGPISAEVVGHLPKALVNTGSGVLTTSRQVAGALGVAVVGALLQPATSLTGRDLAGFVTAERSALAVLGVLAAVAVISTAFLPGRRRDHGGSAPGAPDQAREGS
ncbi:DHA2 family efflux MFS transporter permease subunit [Saccharothrix sp. NRRL B-16348]|uniref:DHA2 family efflux MFS transporter permease subunit n=1 Tax=Saccharothrix sp. NRRL B-16348 TaxID=1415542 RepID=UPI000A696701|nr:DHA2 family efflux MFS transporter permease subunit [Saccharothrix sp. NRRL B-16348]